MNETQQQSRALRAADVGIAGVENNGFMLFQSASAIRQFGERSAFPGKNVKPQSTDWIDCPRDQLIAFQERDAGKSAVHAFRCVAGHQPKNLVQVVGICQRAREFVKFQELVGARVDLFFRAPALAKVLYGPK